MPGWRRIASLAAVLLALLPAAAMAQSAGDEQYEDPFENQQQSEPQATATPAPAQPAQPAPAAPAQAAPAQVAPAPAPVQAAQLPRTGSDAVLPGVLGLILLSAGVALRAHVRRAP